MVCKFMNSEHYQAKNQNVLARRIVLLLFMSLIILVPIISCSSSSDSGPYRIQEQWLGTQINIAVFNFISEENLEKAMDIVEGIHLLFDPNSPDSEVFLINQNAGIEPVRVSQELIDVTLVAQEISRLSEGMFDLSIGPLVDLWGISTLNPQVPTESQIEALLPQINWKNIIIDENKSTIFLSEAGMALDYGGIAKGYAADQVSDFLRSQGIKQALLDFGGNVYGLGIKTDGSKWRIGLQDPEANRNEYIGIYDIADQSIVTSGTYERNFTEDGMFYHHILNPFTGYPSDEPILAVTIIGPSSLWCDGLSTACFLMGTSNAIELIESLDNYEIIVVNNQSQLIMSAGVSTNFSLRE
jgi:thiamine biosynthesis lipoprotein